MRISGRLHLPHLPVPHLARTRVNVCCVGKGCACLHDECNHARTHARRMRARKHTQSLSHTHTHSLSLTHNTRHTTHGTQHMAHNTRHTHTHTHIHTHTHTLTHSLARSVRRRGFCAESQRGEICHIIICQQTKQSSDKLRGTCDSRTHGRAAALPTSES